MDGARAPSIPHVTGSATARTETSEAGEPGRITVPEFGWPDATPAHSMRYVVPAVESLCPPLGPGVRVLDVGCGNGFLSGWFLKRGCAVVGVDLSPQGIAVARRAYPSGRFELEEVSAGLLGRLGEKPFDLAVSTEVVEHVYAPRDWARACFEALRPGGRLICSTPYHGLLKNLIISLAGGWDRHHNPLQDGGHIKFWSRRTLTMLLEEAGFRNVRFRGGGRAPFVWMSMILSGDKPGA